MDHGTNREAVPGSGQPLTREWADAVAPIRTRAVPANAHAMSPRADARVNFAQASRCCRESGSKRARGDD